MEEITKNVLIPHKDILFTLSKIQKAFIAEFNSNCPERERIFPQYPLWAFFSDTDLCLQNGEKVFSFVIDKTDCRRLSSGKQIFFFPAKIELDTRKLNLEILFAEGENSEGTQSEGTGNSLADETWNKIQRNFLQVKFPVSQKSFLTGQVIFKNNGWELYSDKWNTCRKPSH